MNGRHDVKSVKINDELLKEPKDFIEEMIASALNEAVRNVEKEAKKLNCIGRKNINRCK